MAQYAANSARLRGNSRRKSLIVQGRGNEVRTYQSILDKHGGIGPGFDFLRVALAVSILCYHSPPGHGDGVWEGPIRFFAALLVPAFFAISGFLVTGSALRISSLTTFLSFRALRIVPALVAEVLLTAFLLGSLVTDMDLRSYLSSPDLWAYLSNIAGHVHFHLPGVFKNNPSSYVNASLWTIQPEILCYLFIAIVILAGMHRRRKHYAILTIVLLGAYVAVDAFDSDPNYPIDIGPVAQGRAFVFFVAGGLMFLFRDRIPYSSWLAATAIAIALPMLQVPGLAILAVIPVVYCVTFLGLSRLRLPLFFQRGDYSYGIYLFGYPIQQLVVMLSPSELQTWFFNFCFSLPLAVVVAMMSWHIIEKPCLSLKRVTPNLALDGLMLSTPARRLTLSFLIFGYCAVLSGWAGAFSMVGLSLHRQYPIVLLACGLLALLTLLVSDRSVLPSQRRSRAASAKPEI